MPSEAPVVVAGTGPTGLAAALLLAGAGFDVALIGPRPPRPETAVETRTAALFPASLALLEALGVWQEIAPTTAPLAAIRLVDDTDHLLRAPEVLFRAVEVGLASFGANVPNSVLSHALASRAESAPSIAWAKERTVARLEPGCDRATVVLDTGERIEAGLVIAADGRNSPCRTGAGIGTRAWDYPQVAIALSFAHGRPHHGVSTELHRAAGPCTTVPLPGLASSLVWVEAPAIARRLTGLGDDEFRAALEGRLKGLLGAIGKIGPRRAFALSGLTAGELARNRVALVGEAAHVFPPIGAQGLNLGLRDSATLAEIAGAARAAGDDPGSDAVLRRYRAARSADIGARTTAVDLLNRSLLADVLPVQLLRGAGLHLARAAGPLRHWLIRRGLEPVGELPRVMRGFEDSRQ